MPTYMHELMLHMCQYVPLARAPTFVQGKQFNLLVLPHHTQVEIGSGSGHGLHSALGE